MNISPKVLMVEDSETDAFLLITELKRFGFEPLFRRVETAVELRAALTSEEWDVVISDFRLPRFSGLDALKIVQESGLDLPFILVSGAVGDEQAAAVIVAGAHDFLLKDRLARLGSAMTRAMEDATIRRQRARAQAALHESEAYARSQWAQAEAVLEAIPATIAILDQYGKILRVNQAWTTFAAENSGQTQSLSVGSDYFIGRDHGTEAEAANAISLSRGIQKVISGEIQHFTMEYPCHSEQSKRWLIVHVTPCQGDGPARAVVAHVDISAQKKVEEEIRIWNVELESRVHERTAALDTAVVALTAGIAERERLECEILAISECEQERLGQDLHDGLGQELTGISMLGEVLAKELSIEGHPASAAAKRIADYTRKTIHSARRLAKGLYPIELRRRGLLFALEGLANETQGFGIECKLIQSGDPPRLDRSIEIHIYRIIQECISNAMRHGKASRIIIESTGADSHQTFTVTDNGSGFQPPPEAAPGMGLHLMKYRAHLIKGQVSIEQPAAGGCRVTCQLDTPPASSFISPAGNELKAPLHPVVAENQKP